MTWYTRMSRAGSMSGKSQERRSLGHKSPRPKEARSARGRHPQGKRLTPAAHSLTLSRQHTSRRETRRRQRARARVGSGAFASCLPSPCAQGDPPGWAPGCPCCVADGWPQYAPFADAALTWSCVKTDGHFDHRRGFEITSRCKQPPGRALLIISTIWWREVAQARRTKDSYFPGCSRVGRVRLGKDLGQAQYPPVTRMEGFQYSVFTAHRALIALARSYSGSPVIPPKRSCTE